MREVKTGRKWLHAFFLTNVCFLSRVFFRASISSIPVIIVADVVVVVVVVEKENKHSCTLHLHLSIFPYIFLSFHTRLSGLPRIIIIIIITRSRLQLAQRHTTFPFCQVIVKSHMSSCWFQACTLIPNSMHVVDV